MKKVLILTASFGDGHNAAACNRRSAPITSAETLFRWEAAGLSAYWHTDAPVPDTGAFSRQLGCPATRWW